MDRLKNLITIGNVTLVVVFLGLFLAGILQLTNSPALARQILFFVLLIGTLPFLVNMARSLLRREFGIDLIAAVGILSSLAIGQYLAGCVILIMLSGGEVLDQYAQGRARKGLTHLLSSAPTQTHRKKGKEIEDILAGDVQVGDVIVVKQGELVPVDGLIISGHSLMDESALTGESLPVEKRVHDHVMSGSQNLEGVIEVQALKPSSESKYEQIVKLVREAESKKAPFVRLADRYSVWFTLLAFTIAILAWVISRDPMRALAVLVVATPCPLLLATPIAFASGISRAAARGIIVKNGGSLEKLSLARSMLLDKTGTLTLGIPKVKEVESFGKHTSDEILKLSASLDQLSTHILAQSLVQEAHAKNQSLIFPTDFEESVGKGISGKLTGDTYFFGSRSYLDAQKVKFDASINTKHESLNQEGVMSVYLAKGKTLLGVVRFADQIRDDVQTEFGKLAKLVPTLIMATGDRTQVALKIANEIGVKDVRAECLPEDKLAIVKELSVKQGPVVMVGDGVNDAPALAAADVGIVLGSKASTTAHEAGDIIIVVDTFDRVREIIQISKKVIYIAKECIFIGIGLSFVLMLFAAFGIIQPVAGALLQEVVDVLVIFNALRVHFEAYAKD